MPWRQKATRALRAEHDVSTENTVQSTDTGNHRIPGKTKQTKLISTFKYSPHLLYWIPILFESGHVETFALVDTGSVASFTSASLFSRLLIPHTDEAIKNNQSFCSASGERMKTYGLHELDIVLSKAHKYKHSFHVVQNLMNPVS